MFADRPRFFSDVVLDVTLYRGARRALLVRAGLELENLPAHVLKWLGEIQSTEKTEFSETTLMVGISAPAVMYDLLIHGFYLMEEAAIDPARKP
ncbi:hypothetical protein SAMN04488595_103383 [Ralstonia sp. 25mfcol4.1]|uniref:hypothetical protein n=1 Tax=Burkholderiaceae TaxID=119060 RepID=UPI0008814594|nr:hypothetical protein [Ralstonia sp. 25mfcol4.1]SDO98639.1 hypothetical protein SAMN04488595_103383 [Ralstonia sp. 25mfcol4.1]